MPFSCKIVLSEYQKEDGSKRVMLQAIIDRRKAVVPLEFYLKSEEFDKKKQRMVPSHPNAAMFDAEMMTAIAKAHKVASEARQNEKPLTPEIFRDAFRTNLTGKNDVIAFIEAQLKLRKPSLAHNTWKQHTTVINKLKQFRKRITFNEINSDFVENFRNHLLKINSDPTVNKLLKILKHYLAQADKQGMKFTDPSIRVRSFKSTRTALSEDEVNRLHEHYTDPECEPAHQRVLRYFLFSCFTGMRISDVNALTWEKIHDDMLIYIPKKTEKEQVPVHVPLVAKSKRYLPEAGKGRIFNTMSEQYSNRKLKDIAVKCKIKKKLTYHVSRHTFATMLAEDGDIAVVQRLLGHGDIKTSAGYIHTNTQQLIKAMEKRFE